jgi:hypothetical protein
MGGYDKRDPKFVSSHIVDGLNQHWLKRPPRKPLLLITQGDPYEERGISAITRNVCDALNIPRALVFLDPHIADYHALNADLYKVIFKMAYSSMSRCLDTQGNEVVAGIAEQVRAALIDKNAKRAQQEAAPLPKYYFDFAMLQEVTKAACKQICGDLTIAHTSEEINPFSVTSFFQVGLNLRLIDSSDMVAFID